MGKNEDEWVEEQKPIPILPFVTKYVLKLPCPQWQQRNKLNKKFQEFINISKELTINITFTEALEQMPFYAKFKKLILSKKKKLELFEIVALNKEYSVVL